MREIGESTHDANRFADRHAVENDLELAPGGIVVISMESDRGLSDSLDQIEYVRAFLVANGVAEDTTEQPDIVPEPSVFLKRQSFFRTPNSVAKMNIANEIEPSTRPSGVPPG